MFQSFAIRLIFYTLNCSFCPSLDLLWLIHHFVEMQYCQNTPVEPLFYMVLSSVTISTSQWDVFYFQNSMLWVIHVFLIYYSPCVLLKELPSLFPILFLFTYFFLNVNPYTCLCWIAYFRFSRLFLQCERSSRVLVLSSWLVVLPFILLLSEITWVSFIFYQPDQEWKNK